MSKGYYNTDVKSYKDYYPFGSPMPSRHTIQTSSDVDQYGNRPYRYGFNGQESDFEVHNKTKTSTTATFWQYDSRLGRRWNNDPVVKPNESPYAAFANNPIWFTDPNGDDTLSFTGSKDDANKIVSAIQTQFDALLKYSYTRDKEFNITGVKIYEVTGTRTQDENFDELRGNLEGILNEGTATIQIVKIPTTGKAFTSVEDKGGMRFTNEKGPLRIEITEQFFSGTWSSRRGLKPMYDYYVKEARYGVDGWFYTDLWPSKGNAKKTSRNIPFSEAFGHELGHYSRYKSAILSSGTSEENATISIMNRWRSSMGIPMIGLKKFNSGFLGVGSGYYYEGYWEDDTPEPK